MCSEATACALSKGKSMNIHAHGHIFEVTNEWELNQLLILLSSGMLQMAIWLYALCWKHKRPAEMRIGVGA